MHFVGEEEGEIKTQLTKSIFAAWRFGLVLVITRDVNPFDCIV